MTVDFKDLLKNAAKQFTSQQAFAEAIGVSTARLNRALNKGDYPLNALNCLRLAKVTGADPSAILRAAGKGEVADLIEGLYGKVDPSMTSKEREHLRQWKALNQHRREILQDAIDEFLGEPVTHSHQATGRKRKLA